MCATNHQIVLSEHRGVQISRCRNCLMYNIIYRNIHLVLDHVEYEKFRQTLIGLEVEDYNKTYSHGTCVLLKNGKSNVGIAFTEAEVYKLLEACEEARLFEEVFSILY